MLQARLRFTDIDWLDLRAMVKHSPPTSALYRAINPEWWVTPELVFLRDLEHRMSWLMWAKTKDAEKNRNAPKPTPLTEAERIAAEPKREHDEPMPIAAMLKFLGWDAPPRRLPKRDRNGRLHDERGRFMAAR